MHPCPASLPPDARELRTASPRWPGEERGGDAVRCVTQRAGALCRLQRCLRGCARQGRLQAGEVHKACSSHALKGQACGPTEGSRCPRSLLAAMLTETRLPALPPPLQRPLGAHGDLGNHVGRGPFPELRKGSAAALCPPGWPGSSSECCWGACRNRPKPPETGSLRDPQAMRAHEEGHPGPPQDLSTRA